MENLTITTMENLTYDIYFDDFENSNNLGFKESFDFCKKHIERNNGQNSYENLYGSYKGGTVSIVCNETGENVFETEIF